MRLYNEVEETTKVVVVEDYATFNGLLKCKYLFYLLIAYTAFAVINAILAFIDGGYVMAAVNLIVHGSVCASLWMNHLANKELKEDEKPSTKGTKIFQIAHAAKYLVVFILLILGLILVTAINPTPAGEGKSTTTIGLADAMNRIGKNTVVALREPSFGPVLGVKGGAAGGGYAQVIPMEDINLHFTGDLHAITTATNAIAAMLDNHIQQGNVLGIDPTRIILHRCLDMNDRALRNVIVGLGGPTNGVPREDHFDITVASEVMAVLCLATSLEDFKKRIARMVIAYTYDKKPVTVDDIQATGAVTLIMKDALMPNLVQTLEHTPTLIHGGPFANIAHGCNSVIATKTALKMGDYVVTEAGFGADLGAEKFLDIKCRVAGLKPDAGHLGARRSPAMRAEYLHRLSRPHPPKSHRRE